MSRRAVVLLALAGVPGGLAVLLGALFATGTLRGYRIPSSSMEPTLLCAKPGVQCTAASDDHVLALDYIFSSPARGDIVVFHNPTRALLTCGAAGVGVKRIVGLPGETWSEREGHVYIDGRRLDEPYVKSANRDGYTFPARAIPPGQYFLMGDNRSGSCDSRQWGTVPRAGLIGHVVATYWPLSRVTIR